MKKKSGFFQPVRAVRYNDPGNLRPLLKNRVDAARELQPVVRSHVGAWNVGKLLRFDLGIPFEFRHLSHDLVNRLANLIAAKRSRLALLTRDRAARCDHKNVRQIRLGPGAAHLGSGNFDDAENQKQRGNGRFCQHGIRPDCVGLGRSHLGILVLSPLLRLHAA